MILRLLDIPAFISVRLLILALECLPDALALRLARIYVSLIYLCMPRISRIARRNLEIVFPNKSSKQREDIFKESKNVLAQNILGFARIPTLTREKAEQLADLKDSRQVLARLREETPGVGVLIAAMHFDAFEYLIQFPAILIGPFSILGRGFGLPTLDAWWNTRRQMHGNTIFSRSGGYKEIIRRLRNGENVIVMCDQNVKANHATFVDFFGLQAATTKTIALCSMRTGAPIALGVMLSIPGDKNEFQIEPLLSPLDIEGSKYEKIKAVCKSMHAAFERQITRKPEAWFWIHRRWKTRPPGEPEDVYGS
jgi:KDO2-lipid IV(A) lauroyltransferase